MMPVWLSEQYPNLRCTLDCSQTFIQRPWNPQMQAVTWYDYKHHNNLKYLVAIAPNGHISFISKAWAGRAFDSFIVQNSGFLDLVDPTDLIMADRSFTIQEDILFRNASVMIDPPGSGKNQMCCENVLKTKRIANACIHVERAINQLKWFNILTNTVPLTIDPFFDYILLICASFYNKLPLLVANIIKVIREYLWLWYIFYQLKVHFIFFSRKCFWKISLTRTQTTNRCKGVGEGRVHRRWVLIHPHDCCWR